MGEGTDNWIAGGNTTYVRIYLHRYVVLQF